MSAGGLRVGGGAGGVGAQLEDLDALARALGDAAGDAAVLAARALGAVGDPALLACVPVDPLGVARVVDEAGQGAGALCRGAGAMAGLSAAVAGTAAVYRAREDALAAAARAVPLVAGSVLRSGAVVAAGTTLAGGAPAGVLLAGTAVGAAVGAAAVVGAVAAAGVTDAGAGGAEQAREVVVGVVVARPGLVDAVARVLPGVVGVPDLASVARGAGRLARAAGVVVDGDVVGTLGAPAACAAPSRTTGTGAGLATTGPAAGGVADLLRRGQSVAAWRTPRPGEHDSLPAGEPRPVRGQVRVDRVEDADGSLAWVVHVPGTQEWDADGEGSPMDMAANVALVAGDRTAVAEGVAGALLAAGARRGQPVLLVGHSQGGMTALDLAADPALRRAVGVTHVITAGSPVAGRTPPPGVQVLALEHDDDLVPRLDGRSHPDRRDRVVVRAPAPDGPWRTDAVPAHSSSAYVVTAAAVDSSRHPSLVAYREGLAPFLHRDGASCTSRRAVLLREPGPPDGPR